MNKQISISIALITTFLMAICAVGLVLALNSSPATAGVTARQPTGSTPGVVTFNFFASTTADLLSEDYGTTTSATSTNIISRISPLNGQNDNGYVVLAGAKKATFYFGRAWGGGNAGSSTFSVQVSPNGTDWYYWNQWQENASSTFAFTPLTYTTDSFVITAATSTLVESMVLTNDTFNYARCIVKEVTDGTHTCVATVEFPQ